jgi:hypothetical protein
LQRLQRLQRLQTDESLLEEPWSDWTKLDEWFSDTAMQSSNTGLDSIDLTILTPDSLIFPSTPISFDSTDSLRDTNATIANISATGTSSRKLATYTSLITASQIATTTPNLASGSTSLPITRAPQVYVCRIQGCLVRFSQLWQLR